MPGHAFFRFYAELNDFLPTHRRFVSFAQLIELPAAVKDVIEGIGVPHPEIGLILLNANPVEFSHLARRGDRVSVYPEFRNLEIRSLPRLRPPLHEIRFILDGHLGRLATYLRMLGFDSSCQADWDDEVLARISHDEQRILLTRDCGLLKRSAVDYGYFVRPTEPKQQLVEVVKRFDLVGTAHAFSRCLTCNALLKSVPKEAIVKRLEQNTLQYFSDFQLCPTCDRIYWAGSHYKHMERFIEQVLTQSRQSIE